MGPQGLPGTNLITASFNGTLLGTFIGINNPTSSVNSFYNATVFIAEATNGGRLAIIERNMRYGTPVLSPVYYTGTSCNGTPYVGGSSLTGYAVAYNGEVYREKTNKVLGAVYISTYRPVSGGCVSYSNTSTLVEAEYLGPVMPPTVAREGRIRIDID